LDFHPENNPPISDSRVLPVLFHDDIFRYPGIVRV
jgi:hypothetical protein